MSRTSVLWQLERQQCGSNVKVSWCSVTTAFNLSFILSFPPSLPCSYSSLLFSLSVLLSPTVHDSSSPHTSRLIKTQSKWLWQGCHVCSSRGRRGPVRRQEVSYPYISMFLPPAGLSISLLFCHTLSLSHPFPSSVSLLYSCVTFPLSHTELFPSAGLTWSSFSLRDHIQSAYSENTVYVWN